MLPITTCPFQFHYKQEGSYSIGTLGFVDEDCDFIDFTYVSIEGITLFDKCLIYLHYVVLSKELAQLYY